MENDSVEIAKELEEFMGVEVKEEEDPYYNEMDCLYFVGESEAENGENAWIVCRDWDHAEEVAVKMVINDLEESPEIFNKDWLMGHIDEDRYLDGIRSDIEEWVYDTPDSYTAFINGEEPEEEGDYSDDQIQRMADGYLEDIKGQGILNYLEDMGYTEDDLFGQIIPYLDIEKAAQNAVDTDGADHFLDRYDGSGDELPSGAVAFGI